MCVRSKVFNLMTILPGSLDYLYYNEVLDHIPYEVYEMGPVGTSSAMGGLNIGQGGGIPSGNLKTAFLGEENFNSSAAFNQNINNSEYLNSAMKGEMYGNYAGSYDAYVGSGNYQQMDNIQQSTQMYGTDYDNRRGIVNGTNNSGQRRGLNNLFNNKKTNQMQVNGRNGFDTSEFGAEKGGVLNSKAWPRGLAAAAIIIATPLLIIKGKRKPAGLKAVSSSNLWDKINPRNWFRRKLPTNFNSNTTWHTGSSGGAGSGNVFQKIKNYVAGLSIFNRRSNNTQNCAASFKKTKNNLKNAVSNCTQKISKSIADIKKKPFWKKLNPKNWFKSKSS